MSDEDENENNLSSSEDEDVNVPPSKRKRKKPSSDKFKKRKKSSMDMIDDAAVLSGEESSDDDDDDDNDENQNDYVRDDFVVDEVDDAEKKAKSNDGLEDSDDDDDDSGDEDRADRTKRLKKKSGTTLDDDDLELINEARGISGARQRELDAEEKERNRIKAKNETDLRKGLFDDAASDDDAPKSKKSSMRRNVETFDEDGMDDFIEYDDGPRGSYNNELDDEDMMDTREGISEAQLNEANDIFGTDFMDFMAEGDGDEDYDEEYIDGEDGKKGDRYRERGVGVDLAVGSDEDIADESSDDSMFGSDDEETAGLTAEQKAEALRLKKEKRQLKKEERRKAKKKKRAERQKAKLRRAFEPVQLVENFCTERDDEIRATDKPERLFDWNTAFHGPSDPSFKAFTADEEEEAAWIVTRVPAIQAEYSALERESLNATGVKMDVDAPDDKTESEKRKIIESIMHTLRYMHRENFEPEFIRKYRKDYVTSSSVQQSLYAIMDEDAEWERILNAKKKVDGILTELVTMAKFDDDLGADEDTVLQLKDQLRIAKEKLDESVRKEEKMKKDLIALEQGKDEDDDEELFGDDDEDEDEKARKKQSLEEHLNTTNELVTANAEKLETLKESLKIAEDKAAISNPNQRNAQDTSKKVCKEKLWNSEAYASYVESLTDYRQIMDVYKYLSLIKEGTDAIRSKNALGENGGDKKKRGRRFDRDYYRTCVSQGLRSICYQFAISPFRTGIKLEDMKVTGAFSWDKVIPGENMEDVDPNRWEAPVISKDPATFAGNLVASGELVLLNSMNPDSTDDMDFDTDPLRGCRYVAAMELASEPRIRKILREIYKNNAVITTRPTAKGLENIDPFHELYGLHLLKNKSVKDHFPMNQVDLDARKRGRDKDDCDDIDAKVKAVERNSCIQFMNIMKAEKSGHLKHYIHLPLTDNSLSTEDWYLKGDDKFTDREKQNIDPFLNELQQVCFPASGDMDEWGEERMKILRFALTNFLLPQFEAEVKRDLREAAVKIAIEEAGEKLKQMAMEGPYRPSHLLGENRFLFPTGDLPIVGVCCSSDGRDATYLAAVNERGDLVDHLAVPSGTQVDSDKMQEKVITFLMQNRPAAIMVGSLAGIPCRLIARKLGALATQATEKWNNRRVQGQDEDDDDYEARMDEYRRLYPDDDYSDDEEEDWKCNVEMVDDNIAQLFGRSVRGKKEFPDHAVNLKCAVSIARHAKDPLGELTYAWGVASDAGIFGTEMLFLNIHPLQQYLPKTMLLRKYERILSTSVAEVGVDLNSACKHDHLHGLLTFVPGLGPRKAASLKHSMDRIGGVVASRKEILEKRLVGPVVYNNAVAFLRFRDIDELSGQYLHPLDDTRLHPDVYARNNWATKIAIDALELDSGETLSSGDEERAWSAIRDIMQDSRNEVKNLYHATKAEWERSFGHTFNVGGWDPKVNVPLDSWRDKVDELDLETFADIIEDQTKQKWLSHLTMIKWEFRMPFEDPRKPMDPLDRERLFRLLTGETDQTLCPGKEVTGKVARISDFGAHLKLEGDVPAFIPLRNLADGHVESAEDIVQVGTVVTAVVTEVKKDHMSVDLSLKLDDFRKDPTSWPRPESLPELDMAFDRTSAMNIEKGKSKEREERLSAARKVATGEMDKSELQSASKNKRIMKRRACAHPAFRNGNTEEITKELLDGGEFKIGEALIRPSSKNADVLAVHWLVRPGVIKVIEVKEEDKDNDASIGNILKIKDEAYGSIDELIARYIGPMNERVEDLIGHRKFLQLPEADVDEKLRTMKRENPGGVFYFLCWNEKHPGYCSLRFILNQTPRSHPIGITPDGFAWGRKTYNDLDLLLNDFKKNPRGPVSSSSSSRQSAPPSRPNEGGSRGSRWGARSRPPPPPGGGYRPAPPASLPPAPQNAYRPNPPNLPPPPQHFPPSAPPGRY